MTGAVARPQEGRHHDALAKGHAARESMAGLRIDMPDHARSQSLSASREGDAR